MRKELGYLAQRGIGTQPMRISLSRSTVDTLKSNLKFFLGEDFKLPRKKADLVDLTIIYYARKHFTPAQRRRMIRRGLGPVLNANPA